MIVNILRVFSENHFHIDLYFAVHEIMYKMAKNGVYTLDTRDTKSYRPKYKQNINFILSGTHVFLATLIVKQLGVQRHSVTSTIFYIIHRLSQGVH